jgi:uncharacterized membrane protein (GlpM family)
MMLLALKGVVSGVVIVLVNLIARRDPTLAGVIVGFPVVTLLSTFWLALDGAPSATIGSFLVGVLWGLIPTFAFVFVIATALRLGASLPVAIGAGATAWALVLFGVGWAGKLPL